MLGGEFDLEVIDRRSGFISFRVSGKGSKKLFDNEAGGHRFQRIPPTEKRGRVQTSTITVAVLPDDSVQEIVIKDKDIEWSFCRGSGKGGQHRNVTDSAAILFHRPTGISIRRENERSQPLNKQAALEALKDQLETQQNLEYSTKRSKTKKDQVGAGMRGDKRRTIRVQDGTVVDHVTGKKWRWKDYSRGNW